MRTPKVLAGAAILLTAMAVNLSLYLLVPYIQLMINRKLAEKEKAPKELVRDLVFAAPPPEKLTQRVIKEIKMPSAKPPELKSARPAGHGLKIDLSVAGGEGQGLVSGGDRTGPLGSGSGYGKGDGLAAMTYEIGQTDTDAKIVGPDPAPNMPARAEREGVMGLVDLSFVVNEAGMAEQIVVVKEDPTGYGLAAAAIESIRKLRFKPATLAKMTVRQRVKRRYNFEVQ